MLRGWKEIADYTGLSRNNLRKLVDDISFPAVKIGGTWFSSRHLFDAWVEEQIKESSQKTTPEKPVKG